MNEPEASAVPTPVIPPPAGASPVVAHIPAALLRTSLERLRNPFVEQRTGQPLRELPIRVVAAEDGSFEVVDGFKRLARWKEAGHTLIPAIIESPRTTPELKLLLLRSNAPPRAGNTALAGPPEESRTTGHRPCAGLRILRLVGYRAGSCPALDRAPLPARAGGTRTHLGLARRLERPGALGTAC